MPTRKQRGIALITAIWVLAVLIVLVGGFAAMVHSETQIARNLGQLTQARWAARAAIHAATLAVQRIVSAPYTALEGTSLLLNSQDEEIELGGAHYEAVIEDEAGKININTAPADVLNNFFPVEVTDAILDWRDADSTPEPEGAEDDYYSGLEPPYRCKNGPFTTVCELLLVKGVTRDMLDTVFTEDGRTLESLLTVSSWDENTDAAGNERVNIAAADKEELTEAFGEVLREEEIDAILAQRAAMAFSSPADLLRVQTLDREKVAEIYDRMTVTTATRREGLININTAPLEVLSALSGMDEATAQAIVQYRETQGPFTDVGALLALEQVSTSVFLQTANRLTTRSRVFRVTATGQYEDGITHTISCLLQAETSGGGATTRILYWRE